MKANATDAKDETFLGAEKHEITYDQAQKLIQNFRKDPQTPKIHGGAFNRAIFDKILAQSDCDGIRYYYAQNEDGSQALVLVGITSSGADLKEGVYGEKGLPCPPFCEPPHVSIMDASPSQK